MKQNLFIALGVSAALAAGAAKQNVIFLFSDDAGYADWGFQTNLTDVATEFLTPNLDQLAQEGMVCSKGYVSSPVCSPSRAGLLSGREGGKFGYYYNISNDNLPDDGMPVEESTLMERMGELGYKVGVVGKWHIGSELIKQPAARNVDYFYGLWAGSRPYFYDASADSERVTKLRDAVGNVRSNWHNEASFNGIPPDPVKGRHLTDAFGDAACEFITDCATNNENFFLYVPFTSPHGPYTGKQQDMDVFANTSLTNSAGGVSNAWNAAAMTYALDRAVGYILDTLDVQGIASNTTVIMANDNGGPDKDEAHRNTPLRGVKSDTWEGGCRVPYLVRIPDPNHPGQYYSGTYTNMVSTLDLWPTFVHAAGGTVVKDVDGVDLVPYLSGQNSGVPHDQLIIQKGPRWKIRQGSWALLNSGDGIQFFKLNPDGSGEWGGNDASGMFPDKKQELLEAFVAAEVKKQKERCSSNQPHNLHADAFRFRHTQGSSLGWSGSNVWKGEGINSTLTDLDSYADTSLEFWPQDDGSYVSTNDLTRLTGLEFMLNELKFGGSFAGGADHSGTITGGALMFVNSLSNDAPAIRLESADTSTSAFTFTIDSDLILYNDLEITGDSPLGYRVNGDISVFGTNNSITKTGNASIAFAGNLSHGGATVIQGGTVHFGSGFRTASLEVGAAATLGMGMDDTITVDGTAALGGTLTVAPGASSNAVILEAAAVSGTFAATDLPGGAEILYTPTNVTVTGATGIGGGSTVLVGGSILNGDFNAGASSGDLDFSDTAAWVNLADAQTVTATKDGTSLPYDGTRNALLITASTKVFGLDTGYAIAEGDSFDISYVWRDAWGWDDGSDQVRVSLFVTDDNTLTGTRTDLVVDYAPFSTIDSTYELVDHDDIYTAEAADAGQTLFVAIDTTCAASEYARMDNFELRVTDALQGISTYYVSELGDNANDGSGPLSAWRDVDALDGKTFQPGNQVLFNRGDTFSGACTLLGSGETNNPIVIGAYGAGAKPLLTGDANDAGVFLLSSGNEYIEFNDLQLSNFNSNNVSILHRTGIRITPPAGAGEIRRLHFLNLDFLDIKGSMADTPPEDETDHLSRGIDAVTVDDDINLSRFNDFLVDGCTFSNIDGRGISLLDYSGDLSDKVIRGTTYFPSLNVVYQNNVGTNVWRNLMFMRGTLDAVVQFNEMDGTQEGSAFWNFATDGLLVQYNVFNNLYRGGGSDTFICHCGYNSSNSLYQFNYGYNVEGGVMEILLNSGLPNAFQEDVTMRYNIGVDCGWDLAGKSNYGALLISGGVNGAKVYNNTSVQLNNHSNYQAVNFGNWGGTYPSNSIVHNNIFHKKWGGTASTHVNSSKFDQFNNRMKNNLFYGDIALPLTATFSVTGNPLFANPAGVAPEDLKVLFGSVAVAAGKVVTSNGGRDFFGNPVSASSLPTLGFHEYQSDSTIDSDGDRMGDLWESGHGLNPGSASDTTADPDGDRLKNLAEFALGGNPANGADIGHVPTYGIKDVGGGTDRFVYVYPRRTDWQESGLEYDLGASTNLNTGPWVNWAHWITGIGPEAYGPGFDAVTNSFSLDNAFTERFIRLEIE